MPEVLIHFFQSLAARPRLAMLALTLLCLAVYLPGIVRLPAVDRTEAVWAETARDMVARGTWLDPRYDGDVLPAAEAFYKNNEDGSLIPAMKGTLDITGVGSGTFTGTKKK